MATEPTPVLNADIDTQLRERQSRMLDSIEASQDAKAIAAAFRTLVEFARPKPPQQVNLGGGVGVSVTSVEDE